MHACPSLFFLSSIIVETVRLMMNMFDRDNDGTINFHEFIGLWNYIEKWKACFQTYDLDGSGTIDAHELQRALRGFGFNLSEVIVDLIVTKYDVRGRGDISFDNFVQSCVTVQTLTDAFRRIDVAGTGVVTMTYEQVCKIDLTLCEQNMKKNYSPMRRSRFLFNITNNGVNHLCLFSVFAFVLTVLGPCHQQPLIQYEMPT